MPGVNLEDPSLDLGMPPGFPHYIKQEIPPDASRNAKSWGEQAKPQQLSDGEKDSMLESMVENTGLLDLDDDGYWDFHGHSSGRAFLRKMREQFGDLMGKPDAHGLPFLSSRPGSHPTNSPASSMHSPVASRLPKSHDLPTKQCARMLCECALDDALAILRFIHQPTFYAMFDRVYDAPSEDLGSEELGFLPLLYSTIALGSLFARTEGSQLMTNGFENAIEQGYGTLHISRADGPMLMRVQISLVQDFTINDGRYRLPEPRITTNSFMYDSIFAVIRQTEYLLFTSRCMFEVFYTVGPASRNIAHLQPRGTGNPEAHFLVHSKDG